MEPENTENQQLSEVKLSGAIKMTDVTFSYENGPTVLNHLNLNIEAGQYVAIVGKTGCGKSTLMRLLLGFEHPQGGKIYYDERPMNQINPQDIRQQIGTVLQDGKLFVGDIYSNIVICNPMLTMADAWKAAEMAGIADDIRKMPMGMRTLISEENGGISGGQKQRLMIARAIANRPRILFFDEATSALDNLSQKLVSDSLDSLKCTRIVIAHRLSTIRNCDRILVLDEGQVKADGKYDELLETSPLFVELVKRQTL
jgi:ABC-type bacteriocin/lantibiotic exporter with double-glycine peptidase domain